MGSTQTAVLWVVRFCLPWNKANGVWSWLLLSRVKHGATPPLSYITMVWCLIKHRQNFMFTLYPNGTAQCTRSQLIWTTGVFNSRLKASGGISEMQRDSDGTESSAVIALRDLGELPQGKLSGSTQHHHINRFCWIRLDMGLVKKRKHSLNNTSYIMLERCKIFRHPEQLLDSRRVDKL
jgi:hypothetical protein